MTLELFDRLQLRSPLRRGPTLLHPECPIEQAVASSDPHVQEALLRPAIVVHPAQVRYALGPPVLEPYMTLLLAGESRPFGTLRRDLDRRRARGGPTRRRLTHRFGLLGPSADAATPGARQRGWSG
jgi:hypothetical protein